MIEEYEEKQEELNTILANKKNMQGSSKLPSINKKQYK